MGQGDTLVVLEPVIKAHFVADFLNTNTRKLPKTYDLGSHISPRLCPSTAGCSPPSMLSIVLCLLLSCFTFHLGFVHPLQDVALHQCLPLSSVCCFPVSCFTFHLGFVHPLQDVALHQCLPLSSVCCFPVSCFTFHLGFVHPLQDVALYQCLPLSSVCCFPVSPFT